MTNYIRTIPLLVMLSLVGATIGCGGDVVDPIAQVTDPEQLYFRLVLDYPAINLSTVTPYNTVQVTATPFNADGNPMEGLPAPTYRSADPSKVQVSANGTLTALQATTNLKVIAELMGPGNVLHADTALVNVITTTPPILDTVTLDPTPPDTAIVAVVVPLQNFDLNLSNWMKLPALLGGDNLSRFRRARTATGDSIGGLVFDYYSLDPTIIAVTPSGLMQAIHPGSARLVVRTFAYGVSRSDTATFLATAPAMYKVTVQARDNPLGGAPITFGAPFVIRQNGIVFWFNTLQPVEVVFDDPSVATQPGAVPCNSIGAPVDMCGTGDFSLSFTTTGIYRARQFPVIGTYSYHDSLTGAAGEITVVPVDSL